MPPKTITKKPAPAKKAPVKKVANPTAGASTSKKGAAATPKKEEAKAEYISETEIGLKQIKTVVENAQVKFTEVKRWPLVIDSTGNALTFLRHTDANVLTALQQSDHNPETIRRALLGALRYSKPLVLDMLDFESSKLFTTLTEAFDRVHPGLMDLCLTNAIRKEENIEKLIRDEDGDEYSIYNFSDERLDGFKLIVMTTNVSPPKNLFHKFITYKIV